MDRYGGVHVGALHVTGGELDLTVAAKPGGTDGDEPPTPYRVVNSAAGLL